MFQETHNEDFILSFERCFIILFDFQHFRLDFNGPCPFHCFIFYLVVVQGSKSNLYKNTTH